ncbi:phage terminase small subunit P27 family [Paucilactobacillus sp. N302-9]
MAKKRAGRKKKLNAGDDDRSDQRKRTKVFNEAQDVLKELQKTPPQHLDNRARELWRILVPELAKLGTIKQLDRVTLEVYCTTYSVYRNAEEQIKKYGTYLVDEYGTPFKKSPQIMVITDCARTLKSLGADLGLSFDARSGQITEKDSSQGTKTESNLDKAKKVIDIGSRV